MVNLVSLAVSFWAGSPRFLLAKDGAVTSAMGIAVLVSVLAGQPLMTAAMRPFLVRGDGARDAAFGRLLAASPRFQRLAACFSVVWGVAFVVECAARVTVAFTLPVSTVVWLSTVVTVGSIGAAVVAGTFFSAPMDKLVTAEAAQSGSGH